jgi:hypothetical protein
VIVAFKNLATAYMERSVCVCLVLCNVTNILLLANSKQRADYLVACTSTSVADQVCNFIVVCVATFGTHAPCLHISQALRMMTRSVFTFSTKLTYSAFDLASIVVDINCTFVYTHDADEPGQSIISFDKFLRLVG